MGAEPANSCTCMKRFSNIVSVICDEPLALVISAMNWACRSVGKAGKRRGGDFDRRDARAVAGDHGPLIGRRDGTPVAATTSSAACSNSGRAFCSITSPPAMATAIA